LAPAAVDVEQIGLVHTGRHEIEQHHADGERLVARNPAPELVKAGEREAGVARLVKIGLVPPAAEIANPRNMEGEAAAIIVATSQPLGRLGEQVPRKISGALGAAQFRLLAKREEGGCISAVQHWWNSKPLTLGERYEQAVGSETGS
jgi:hypothetical protein